MCVVKDLYYLAAMLSLRRIKALFLHGKPWPDANSAQGLPCKNKAFYSPETQHGCRVIKVYWLAKVMPLSQPMGSKTKIELCHAL